MILESLLLATSLQSNAPSPAYDLERPREERIRLAESAAPPEVAGSATVYVLERSGYVKVRDGSNGFTCIVDRQHPLNQEPTCFDAEGSTTTLPVRLAVEELRAAGQSEDAIRAEVETGYQSGRFRAPQKPGIVYMLSKEIYLYSSERNQVVRGTPHLMFYAPYATDKDIGSPPSGRNMPRVLRAGQPDAYIIVFPGDGQER
jgi:hypothetical protein